MTAPTPTLLDVARLAKVSPATVSRALNRPNLVRAATLHRVQSAVVETGFVVNQSARNLRQQKSWTLLVLVPYISTPLIGEILIGMEQTAARLGYSILIAHTEDFHGESRNLLHYIHHNKTDGIVMLGGNEQYNRLAEHNNRIWNIPIVAVNENITARHIPTISVDNYLAARSLVQHLVGLGHRQLGHIAGPVNLVSSAFERNRGFVDEMLAQQLTPCWQTSRQYNMESGAQAARQWIALPTRPTAVVCSCDEVAFGFNSEIYRNGYRVPRDVSVTGFDNVPLAEFSVPALTTVRQPRIQIGEIAITTLLGRIDSTSNASDDQLLAGELVVRFSTARQA